MFVNYVSFSQYYFKMNLLKNLLVYCTMMIISVVPSNGDWLPGSSPTLNNNFEHLPDGYSLLPQSNPNTVLQQSNLGRPAVNQVPALSQQNQYPAQPNSALPEGYSVLPLSNPNTQFPAQPNLAIPQQNQFPANTNLARPSQYQFPAPSSSAISQQNQLPAQPNLPRPQQYQFPAQSNLALPEGYSSLPPSNPNTVLQQLNSGRPGVNQIPALPQQNQYPAPPNSAMSPQNQVPAQPNSALPQGYSLLPLSDPSTQLSSQSNSAIPQQNQFSAQPNSAIPQQNQFSSQPRSDMPNQN